MGMFDHISVTPPQNCKTCGERLIGWQSKDGDCLLDMLDFLQVRQFYDLCDGCDTWHEYNAKVEHPQNLEDYDLTVITRGDR